MAEMLAQRISQPLALLEQGLSMREQFTPEASRREFTLLTTDIAVAIILPWMLAICRKEAPQVSFRVLELSTEASLAALREGSADLAIGFNPALHGSLLHQRLFETDYACIVRRDHPRIQGKMTRDDFMREQHAVAQAAGTGHHVVEAMMLRMGLVNQIGARAPHFLALPLLVAASDMIATVPRPLAELLQPVAPVAAFAAPVKLPRPAVDQFWHERMHDDAGGRWLRQLVPRAVEQVMLKGPAGFERSSSR
jgi:DNA-binding transcriptional LysR family regulator